jgi:hypothetical protein
VEGLDCAAGDDGAISGETFLARVEQFLLLVPREGGIVMMENPGAHKVYGVREAFGAHGPCCGICHPIALSSIPLSKRSSSSECSYYFWHYGYGRASRNSFN